MDGDVIDVLADCTSTEAFTISCGGAVTINLNGWTLKAPKTLTITNGTNVTVLAETNQSGVQGALIGADRTDDEQWRPRLYHLTDGSTLTIGDKTDMLDETTAGNTDVIKLEGLTGSTRNGSIVTLKGVSFYQNILGTYVTDSNVHMIGGYLDYLLALKSATNTTITSVQKSTQLTDCVVRGNFQTTAELIAPSRVTVER